MNRTPSRNLNVHGRHRLHANGVVVGLADCWRVELGGGMDDYEAIRAQDIDVTDKPHAWIQWKGTDVCMDVWCGCGAHMHFDGMFAYNVKCPHCKDTYAVGQNILLIKLTPEQASRAKCVQELTPEEVE